MRALLFIMTILLAACSPSLDVGRAIDARSIAVALDTGLSSQGDVLEAFGWPDSAVALEPDRWRYEDGTGGLPAGTAVVWSYYHLHVANRFALKTGPFRSESHLVRFYFSADGFLLGWDQTGTNASLRTGLKIQAPSSVPSPCLN